MYPGHMDFLLDMLDFLLVLNLCFLGHFPYLIFFHPFHTKDEGKHMLFKLSEEAI